MMKFILFILLIAFTSAEDQEEHPHSRNIHKKIHEPHDHPERLQKPIHPEERKSRIGETISTQKMTIDEHRRNVDLKRAERRMRLEDYKLKKEEIENRHPIRENELHLKEEKDIHNLRRMPPRPEGGRPRVFIRNGVKVQEKVEV